MKCFLPLVIITIFIQGVYAGTTNHADARQELVNEFAQRVAHLTNKEGQIKAFTDFIYAGTKASNKTDALLHRMIGWRNNSFVSGSWQLADSLRWTYSGTRGSVLLTNNSYDTKNILWWNNNAIEDKERHTYTRDGNGSVTIYLYEKWNAGTFVNYEQNTQVYNSSIFPISNTRQNWVTNAWQNYDRGLFTYDGDDNFLSETYENWQSNAWVGDNRQLFTYNNDGYMLSHSFDNWVNSAWLTNDLFTSTLNAQNRVVTDVRQSDNGGSLVNNSRWTYTYDANGNQTSWTTEDWVSNNWVNDQRFLSTYDASNNLLNQTEQTWIGGAWQSEDSTVYVYNSNNDYTIRTVFGRAGNALVPQQREINTYNGELRTEYLNESWNGSAWVNDLRYTYTYDGNGLGQLMTYQTWDGSNWVNETQTEYDFDAGHRNLLHSRNQTWTNNAWENTTENYRYYEQYTPSGIEDAKAIQLSIFPNPTANMLTIEFESSNNNSANISIANATGQTVMELKTNAQNGANRQQINTSALSAGVYFIQIKQGATTGYSRFTKQ